MGLTKRLYDLARANLGALIDRKPEGELGEFSDEELQAELVTRGDRRKRQDEARAAREAAERAARERSQKRGGGPAGGTKNAGSSTTGAPPPSPASARGASSAGSATPGAAGAKTGAGTKSRASTPPPPSAASAERKARARLYALLETPDGADLEAVKKNFRRLMRAHHPDLAVHTPEKQRAALEMTKILTVAYDDLERRLTSTTMR